MRLNILKRSGSKHSENNQIRREGNIPAVVYSAGSDNEKISINGAEFAEVLRKIVSGRLATTKFTLVDGKNEVVAFVKEIQYHPTTYQVWHLDFIRANPGISMNVNVPIEFKGVADCVGIKLGGFLRTVVRQLKVRCVPEHIPDVFTIDVTELTIGQSKRLSAIEMPKEVKPVTSLNEVAVVIAKR